MHEICDLVIVPPGFDDNPNRCFKLPFLACEALTSEVFAITRHLFKESENESQSYAKSQKVLPNFGFTTQKFPLFDKLMSFFDGPDACLKKKGFLNPTLGGYINKIVSFWMIKRTDVFLDYLTKRKNLVQQFFNHLYLTQCVTDLIVRLCTIQDIKNANPTNY